MAKDEKIFEGLFSEVKKQLNIEEKPENETQENTDDKKVLLPIEEIELEFKSLQNKVNELEEKRLIAVAETQDTVRRFKNESQNVKKYGGEKLASEIIGPIDTFRKVLQTSPDDPQIKNYLIGFEMVINQIDQALNNAGVQMINTKIGDDFVPELHNAIEEVETDKVAPGKICAIISNGYKLYERVIKHTVVKVAKNK